MSKRSRPPTRAFPRVLVKKIARSRAPKIAIRNYKPTTISEYKRKLIANLSNLGHSAPAIARMAMVSPTTAYRLLKEMQTFGVAKQVKPPQRERKKRDQVWEVIQKEKPMTTHMIHIHLKRCRISISRSYLRTCLRQLGFRLVKPLSCVLGNDAQIAEERVTQCRVLRDIIREAESKKRPVIYFDESHFQQSAFAKTARVWSLHGNPVILDHATKLHSHTACVVPFYCREELVYCGTVPGYATGEAIYEFLETILTTIYPSGPQPLFIADNASIHKCKALEPLKTPTKERTQVLDIHYLPPYSPWLNPVEYCFHRLKSFFRRTIAGHIYLTPEAWTRSLKNYFTFYEKRNFNPGTIFKHVDRMYDLTISNGGIASEIYADYHSQRRCEKVDLPITPLFKTLSPIE